MQSPKENEKQQPKGEAEFAQSQELSAAWRALLGLQAASLTDDGTQVEPAVQVLPQGSDPWSMLVQAQGMETVDLQKIRLHALHPAANDADIEHALNMIQEANGQSAPQEKKAGEARSQSPHAERS